ncbi:MAG: NlpC/P60 family protein [Deltaproteobacteria bacterium]|nr:MAG: NlpC/P60 family protein [Deltaproteobacteria bacterium]
MWVASLLLQSLLAGASLSSAYSASPEDVIERTASSYLGEHYVWGDAGENGFDCSSFVQSVFRQSGYSLPRTSREQVAYGAPVALENVRAGDLLFFTTHIGGHRITHVGIALSGNRMIHAAKGHHRVVISRWDSRYFLERWYAARRPV